ncbi:MAG: phage tail sheath family protein [Rhodothalassiaceae bacterium]
MVQYQRPGAYVTETPPTPNAIAAADTSTTVFLSTAAGPTQAAASLTTFEEFVRHIGAPDEPDQPLAQAVHAFFLNGGRQALVLRVGDGSAPAGAAAYAAALNDPAADIEQAGLLVLPGCDCQTHKPITDAVTQTCARDGQRMLLVDPPKDVVLTSQADIATLALPASPFAALYYPWVEMANPLAPDAGSVSVAPSGAVAGIYARTEGDRGAWTSPAGWHAHLAGVTALTAAVTDTQQSLLNPAGINVLRSIPRLGPVVWGARTLASSDPEYRYVPVRRLSILLRRSLTAGLSWVVFEPNAEPLWQSVRASVGAFLHALFGEGAFAGRTVDDAYFVQCGLGRTMTEADIQAGRLIVEIGFAPLKPAEFLIERLVLRADPPPAPRPVRRWHRFVPKLHRLWKSQRG